MKNINIKVFSAFLLICITQVLSAQSMRRMDDSFFARKIGDNLYEPVPAGVVSYSIENGKFWQLMNGVKDSDKPKGYFTRSDGKVYYYNQYDDIIGCYIPAESRYYVISSSGKQDSYATILNGIVVIGSGDFRYRVDEDFTPEVVGLFLFIH